MMSNLDDDPKEVAEKAGLVMFESDQQTLLLDLDEPDAMAEVDVFERLLFSGKIEEEILTTRSNGGNTHVYIRLKYKTPSIKRIVMQASLGSDGLRELLSLERVNQKVARNPSVLFETAEEAVRVRAWLASWPDDDIPF